MIPQAITFIFATLLLLTPLNTQAFPAQTPEPDNLQLARNYLERIRSENKKDELEIFFRAFPKGADLHHHFMGASGPDLLAVEAAKRPLYLDKDYNFVLHASGAKNVSQIINNYQTLLAFREAFTVTGGNNSVFERHGHFFQIFGKMSPLYDRLPVLFLNDIRSRAADEQVQYIESTTFWDQLNGPQQLFALLKQLPSLSPVNQDSMTRFHNAVINLPDFINLANRILQTFSNLQAQSSSDLNCHTSKPEAGCNVTVRFLHETHRSDSLEEVFLQLILAFHLAELSLQSNQPNIVGINLVGAEDGTTAYTDYSAHLDMLSFLKQNRMYPNSSEHISLHAGELTKQIAPFAEVSHSLAKTIIKVLPARIGHGVSLLNQTCPSYVQLTSTETCPELLLKVMDILSIAVEIPFISNKELLKIEDDDHPFPAYHSAGVATVLATDNPGILKTDLTTQFVEIFRRYPQITLDDAIKFARDSLEYSFLPGKSLWQQTRDGKPDYSKMVKICETPDSSECKQFLSENLKASLEFEHHKKLSEFMTNTNNFSTL